MKPLDLIEIERLAALPQPPKREEPQAEVSLVSEPALDTKARNLCVTSHMHLAGVLDLEPPPEHEVLFSLFPQREPGIITATEPRFRLILWPRGSGKSTSAAVIDVIQAISHDVNVRILYQTSDDDLARNRLQQVANYFDDPTEKFKALFPEMCGLEQRTVRQFIVRGRTTRSSVDPTFAISTPGMNTTGSHWDLILLDDLVTYENSRTKEGLEKSFEAYRKLIPQLSGSGQLIIIGTCYDPDDAYARIEKAAAKECSGRWLIDRRSCWAYGCQNCGHKDLCHSKGKCRHRDCTCTNFESDNIRGVLIDRHVTRHHEVLGWTVDELLALQNDESLGKRNFAFQYELDARETAGLTLPKVDDAALRKLFGCDPNTI